MVGLAGSGSDWSEVLMCGVSVSRAGRESRPRVSSRARRQPPLGVVEELAVDGVGESAFQASHGFLMPFAGGAFALIVGASVSVVADLG